MFFSLGFFVVDHFYLFGGFGGVLFLTKLKKDPHFPL